MKYFGEGMYAERYARARPNIHPAVIERFKSFAKIDAPFSLGLDVGCGTGQSTIVLTKIAKRVIGIDPSIEMLKLAIPHPNVEYQQSSAEETPFPDGQFDLISAAQAFHWFDHEKFLTESHRLLKVPGWLLVYTSWFTGEMKGQPKFADWFKGEYLRRYPTPPRNRTPVTEELAHKHGFIFSGEEEFNNEIGMTLHRFTEYQLSTTNIIAVVKQGKESFENAAQWIQASLKPFFVDEREKVFLFSGKIWYLEKAVT